MARCLSEAVVEVGAVQPGGPFGAEGIRAFLDFNMLPVHIGNPDVNRRILVERVGGTRAQPQAILIRNGNGAIVGWYRAVIEGDTGTEGPVIVIIIGGPQRKTLGVLEAFLFIEQRLAVAAGGFQLLELTPAGVGQAIVDRPLRRHAVIAGQLPHFRQVKG